MRLSSSLVHVATAMSSQSPLHTLNSSLHLAYTPALSPGPLSLPTSVSAMEFKESQDAPPAGYHATSNSSPEIEGSSFARKLDPKEQARMNAMFATISKQAFQSINNRTDETVTLERQGESATGEALDLKAIPTLYFKSCTGCHFTIDHRTTKVLIEDCKDTTFTFNGSILTSTLEAWKCKNVVIRTQQQIRTVQLDLTHTLTYTLPSLAELGTIVWNSVELLTLDFTTQPQHNLTTGFAHMLPLHPDSNLITDQFIIRSHTTADNQPAILHERCIRLKNGFLSTEREAVEWDRKNELLKERYMAHFLKEGGITINKKKVEGKKLSPNDPCDCNSGKKYKKSASQPTTASLCQSHTAQACKVLTDVCVVVCVCVLQVLLQQEGAERSGRRRHGQHVSEKAVAASQVMAEERRVTSEKSESECPLEETGAVKTAVCMRQSQE